MMPEFEPLDSVGQTKSSSHTRIQWRIGRHLLLKAFVSNIVESAIKTDTSMALVVLQSVAKGNG
jgi:hypothetical protein